MMARLDERVDRVVDRATEAVSEKLAEVKPRLRGWMHAATAPLALAAFVVLVVLSPTGATRVGSIVFGASALLVFTTSGIYHRGTWSPRMWEFLRRMDHANIFVLIAGSYTPFALLLLHGRPQVVLLSVIWTAALAGMVFRIFWIDAPRWLYTPMYMALGWVAVFFLPQFIDGSHRFGAGIAITVLALVASGGLLYTLGGVVYALKRPNPSPRWFGFHEVFHTLTIAAFALHFIGVSMAAM